MEVTTIYLAGGLSPDGQHVSLPLSSCAVMLVVSYTQPSVFHLAFTQGDGDGDDCAESHSDSASTCVSLPYSGLSSLSHEFLPHNSVPQLVSNVLLPAVLDSNQHLVRSGLCVVVRHLVKVAHAASPQHCFLQLLGFRQGSLRMCAEVSGWTKLCEVELPSSVTCLVQQVTSLRARQKTSAQPQRVALPADLVKLEAHFEKLPKIHNDDRRRRSELSSLQTDVNDPEKRDDIARCCRLDGMRFLLERMSELPHGWTKFRVDKQLRELGGDGGGGGGGGGGQRMRESGQLSASLSGSCSEPGDGSLTGVGSVDQVCEMIRGLSYLDVQFVHLYSEGVEMTIADLCLFSYLYFLLECVQFDTSGLTEYLPHVLTWLRHMVTLPRLQQASSLCAFNFPRLKHGLFHSSLSPGGAGNSTAGGGGENSGISDVEGGEKNSGVSDLEGGEKNSDVEGGEKNSSVSDVEGGEKNSGISAEGGEKNILGGERNSSSSEGGGKDNSSADRGDQNGSSCSRAEGGKEKGNMEEGGGWNSVVHFCRPPMDDVTEDDMELSRRCRTKHKALKPEVQQALTCMKARGIEPVVGCHPRGSAVSLDWDLLPPCVNPREGDVPAKRVQRKCQQLENLVTAVLEVATPGDIIVDFCSGGGHLGLAIAHLLPHCMVYLVENKEESLLRAESRMAALPSDNVVLYQCNMDYFVGRFDVGVCLHACGSATDMVLHQCLHNQAAFVVCPCCYGSIQQTHLLSYPRSRLYQDRRVTYKEFLTLGHAADQTEFNIALEQQGRQCMNLVDSDRAELAREAGYAVTLTSLQPLTCSPKNNLLIGHKCCSAAAVPS